MFKVEENIKSLNRRTIKLSKKTSAVIGRMKVNMLTCNISKYTVSDPDELMKNKYMISIVQSNNSPEHKICQISCDTRELPDAPRG